MNTINDLENLQDGYFSFDREWRIVYLNSKAVSIVGRNLEELSGKVLWEETPEITGTLLEDAYRKAMDWRVVQHLEIPGEVSGEGYHIFVCPCEVGLSVYWQKKSDPVEELKAIEENLAHEVADLTKLHELSTRFFLSDSERNVYQEILGAALELTAADKGHLTAVDESGALQILASHDFQESSLDIVKSSQLSAIQEVLKSSKRQIFDNVSTMVSLAGTEDLQMLWEEQITSLQSTPLISSTGKRVGILTTHYGSVHQFTERELRMLDLLARQAADAIERTKAEEALFLSERRAHALIDELRKMDENKNEFLSVLSHELRNPLASILMSHALLELVSNDSVEAKQAREAMQRQMDQLTRLVDDLLNLTRITRNKLELKRKHIELNDFVSKASADYRVHFDERQILLEVKRCEDELFVEADPSRLTQVVGNLLHNALKFAAAGDHVRLRVVRDDANREAIIEVEDNGLGIDPNLLPELFQPFTQAESSSDRCHGGLGLGLAIVKGLVEAHDGSVSAWSEGIGKGTRFTIRLPALSLATEPQEEVQPEGAKPSRHLRILVIDDSPDIAEILSALLSMRGHEVTTANDGLEGVNKARMLRPEIILCDIGLPIMDGFGVAQTIRADEELRNTTLIAISGYAQAVDVEKAIAAGFDWHLAKPLDIAVMEKILDESPHCIFS